MHGQEKATHLWRGSWIPLSSVGESSITIASVLSPLIERASISCRRFKQLIKNKQMQGFYPMNFILFRIAPSKQSPSAAEGLHEDRELVSEAGYYGAAPGLFGLICPRASPWLVGGAVMLRPAPRRCPTGRGAGAPNHAQCRLNWFRLAATYAVLSECVEKVHREGGCVQLKATLRWDPQRLIAIVLNVVSELISRIRTIVPCHVLPPIRRILGFLLRQIKGLIPCLHRVQFVACC